jgi:hypothetical protein
MKPFNHNYFLGYVNQVTPQFIKIHFPSSSLLEKFNHQGTLYSGGNVGNFIVVEGDEFGFLARIIEIDLPDGEKKSMSEKAIQNDETAFHPSGTAELLLSFNVFEPKKIEKTVSKYPSIGAKVYSCSDEQIAEYIKEFGAKKDDKDNVYINLGKLTSNNSKCRVSLNSIFGRHCAIVGTTGGGKSWTVAKLISETIEKTNNKVILIDATGEYKESFGNNEDCVFGENVYFPFKYLTNSDFCFLFQENSPNTVAALCEAIHSLKLIHLKKMPVSMCDGVKHDKNQPDFIKAARENISNFKDCDFDIEKLSIQVANECVKLGKNNKYEEDNFKLGYTSHLISRINLFLNNNIIRSSFGINIEERKKQSNLINIIEEFLEPKNTQSVLRIGFEKISNDFFIRELVVEFLCYKLLTMSREEKFKENPLVLFIDEAHQFLNKRINAEDNTVFSLQNIDIISKECRKYGLFLCLSTQMPRDIPVGTLSQMGTFIVHRLINELDKKAIENACSSANRSALSFLPILGEGEALLVGVDFPMPLLLKIDEPDKKPNSKTPKFKPKKPHDK